MSTSPPDTPVPPIPEDVPTGAPTDLPVGTPNANSMAEPSIISTDAPVVKLIETFEERTKRHDEENLRVRNYYLKNFKHEQAIIFLQIYADAVNNGSRKCRNNSNKLIIQKASEIKKIKEQKAELARLDDPEKKNKKREEIANLEIDLLCNTKAIEDAKTHFALFEKLNTAASLSPTPETIKRLKNQTQRINNAIKKQQGLLAKVKKSEKASIKALNSLTNEEVELARKILANPSAETIENVKNKKVLDYVQLERSRLDAYADYELSRKIFANALAKSNEKDIDSTEELKNQLASLSDAIKERKALRDNLKIAEDNKLKIFNEQVESLKEINDLTAKAAEFRTQKDIEKLIILQEKYQKLALESEQQTRELNDAYRLNQIANQLMEEASKTGDAVKLAKQLKELKVAADRQKKYRDALARVEKRILRANATPPKGATNKKRFNLQQKQLAREKKDAELAYAMMTELIEDAAKNKNTENLSTQCNELKAGIGGRKKYSHVAFGQVKNRIALENAENNLLDAEIKNEKNKKRLNDSTLNHQQIVECTIQDKNLTLAEEQAKRRVKYTEQDYDIGNKFLEKARKDKNPQNLPAQFRLMVATVADRDEMIERLEAEENKQLKKKNEILKAELEVNDLKKKHTIEEEKLKEIEKKDKLKETPGIQKSKSPEFIAQQSVVYKSDAEIKRREWKLTKLKRREAENKTFNERRLANAEKNMKDANTLLKIILNPNASPENIKNAQEKLRELKQKIEAERKLEKKLAPTARVKERAQYRDNLEKAEEKRLKHIERLNLHEIEVLKAEALTDQTARTNALKKLRKKFKELKAIDDQIKREEEDAELIYNFSARLLQASIEDTTGEKAKLLKKQFKELRAADKIQKDLRDRIRNIDKKMNSRLHLYKTFSFKTRRLKTKAQLQRQKNALIFGHQETQKLIKAALAKNPPDPKGLAEDCKNLKEGIGGRRSYAPILFGQERNREALDERETLDSKNEANLTKSKKRLDKAGINPENSLTNKERGILEHYEDCVLAKTQSERRLKDAKNDYDMGNELLKNAVKDGPDKSQRLKNLKKQFAVLKVAIEARNKLAIRLGKIERNAKITERKDAKKIRKAEKEEASLSKKIIEAKKKLEEIDPNDTKALEKQQAKIDKLEEKRANKQDKIRYLKAQQAENKIRHKALITEAQQLHVQANQRLKSLVGSTNENAAKASFTPLHNRARNSDKHDKQQRKAQEKSYKNAIKQSKKDNKAARQAKAAARQALASAPAASAPAATTTPAATTSAPQPSKFSKTVTAIKETASHVANKVHSRMPRPTPANNTTTNTTTPTQNQQQSTSRPASPSSTPIPQVLRMQAQYQAGTANESTIKETCKKITDSIKATAKLPLKALAELRKKPESQSQSPSATQNNNLSESRKPRLSASA